jgi:hypothetical protein
MIAIFTTSQSPGKKNLDDIRKKNSQENQSRSLHSVALHLGLYRNWALPDTLLMKDDFETRSE